MNNKFPTLDSENIIAEFHRLFEHPILPAPGIPNQQRCDLRYNLLSEEVGELWEAIEKQDIVGIADALADIQYVLSGAVLEFGLGNKFKDLVEEVHRSNMSKACSSIEEATNTIIENEKMFPTENFYHVEREGRFFVYRSRDNKTIKSINYSPANLRHVLNKS